MTPRGSVFYLHYNRNAFKQGDPRVWSIRTSRGCFHATKVICTVPLETVVKQTGPNPRAFLKGHYANIDWDHGTYYVN